VTVAQDVDFVALIEAYRDGDESARDRLVERYMPLVRSLAGRYAGRGEPQEDLVQVGSIGLLLAIEQGDLEDPPNVRGHADDGDLAAVRAKPIDCAEQDAERHRVDERRIRQVDDQGRRAAVDGVRHRLAQLRRRVEVGLPVDRDRDHRAGAFDGLDPEVPRVRLAHRLWFPCLHTG
jgi:hypothetical protein